MPRKRKAKRSPESAIDWANLERLSNSGQIVLEAIDAPSGADSRQKVGKAGYIRQMPIDRYRGNQITDEQYEAARRLYESYRRAMGIRGGGEGEKVDGGGGSDGISEIQVIGYDECKQAFGTLSAYNAAVVNLVVIREWTLADVSKWFAMGEPKTKRYLCAGLDRLSIHYGIA